MFVSQGEVVSTLRGSQLFPVKFPCKKIPYGSRLGRPNKKRKEKAQRNDIFGD